MNRTPFIDNLKRYALIAATQLGLYYYSIDCVELDFANYLLFRRYAQCPSRQSGFGNPFSPIIFVGNEHAYSVSTNKHLKKIFDKIDEIWTLYLCNRSNEKNIKTILKHWIGPKDEHEYHHKSQNSNLTIRQQNYIKKCTKFYTDLRLFMQHSKLLLDYPFSYVHTQYYPKRQGGHYWIGPSKVLKELFKDILKINQVNKKIYYSVTENFKLNLNEYFLSYCFMTEASLSPSKKTSNKNIQTNYFFKYILISRSPRLLICGSHIDRKNIKQLGEAGNIYKIIYERNYQKKFNLKDRLYVIITSNQKLIILTRNLSNGLPNELVRKIAWVMKEEAKRLL